MRTVLAFAALALGLAQAAVAQSGSPSQGLTFSVGPSGIDDRTDEARHREDRLERLMQRNEFLFRNICTHCGGGVDRVGAYAPFNPIEALQGSGSAGR